MADIPVCQNIFWQALRRFTFTAKNIANQTMLSDPNLTKWSWAITLVAMSIAAAVVAAALWIA